jgi:hypothetical protein
MAGKKSALTAALAGGAPAPAPVPRPGLGGLANPDAFPCLQHAPEPEGASAVDALAGDIQSIDIKSVSIVGSVPTNTILPSGKQLVSGCGCRSGTGARGCSNTYTPTRRGCAAG